MGMVLNILGTRVQRAIMDRSRSTVGTVPILLLLVATGMSLILHLHIQELLVQSQPLSSTEMRS